VTDPGVYVIVTSPGIQYRTLAEICVEENIRVIQLREKTGGDRDILRKAEILRKVTEGTETKLIINDRPDIALLCGADGVHLGQDDLPPESVRRMMPGGSLLGLSTHNPDQLKHALEQKPDYAGFGPVYATTTKTVPDPVTGTDLLKKALKISRIPVIAIGGLFPENLGTVLSAGARNICLVRYLMEPDRPEEFRKRIRYLQTQLKQRRKNNDPV
jgi:thiamine-phosphate pyrophosphorylase